MGDAALGNREEGTGDKGPGHGTQDSWAGAFIAELKKIGFDFFTGVPCSFLKGAFSLLEKEPRDRYVPAVREDAALGFAAGAYLGGRRPVLLMQNSALGVAANALAQLNRLYEIPCLMIVSWRGSPGADRDAPEHVMSGSITEGLLGVLQIPFELLDPSRMAEQLRTFADLASETRKPTALLVPPGVLE